MTRMFLVRGMLVGILAGLLSFGFLKLYGEPQVDRAIELMPSVLQFLRQNPGERTALTETCERMEKIASAWSFA